MFSGICQSAFYELSLRLGHGRFVRRAFDQAYTVTLWIMVESGEQSILCRAAHVQAGDYVDYFDLLSHKMESLAGEIGQMKDSGRLKLSFFLTKMRGQ